MLNKNEFNLPNDRPLPNTSITMPHVILADEAYPLLECLLRPYPRRDLCANNEYFNSRLSRARRCIECAYGIINSKWRVLWKPIETVPSFAEIIVKAICILHNTIIDKEGIEAHLQGSDGFIQSNRNGIGNRISRSNARFVRDTFRDYLCRNRY